MGFSILYVCTGNVCRSPMAELLLRSWAGPGTDVSAASAGMRALVGQGIDRGTASALGQLGIDPTRHRARQFEPWMAESADLVLTAERAHRDAVMEQVPSVLRRAFTMKEFARLARHAPPGPPRDVIDWLAGIRGVDGHVPDTADNMPDPYRAGIAPAKAIAEQITTTVHALLEVLGTRRASEPAPAGGRRRPRPN